MKRVMQKLFTVLLFCLMLWPGAASAAAFLSVIEEVPLMDGFAEVPGSQVEFDSPQGRIAEVTAEGAVTQAETEAFYNDTLPQLGWEKVAVSRFKREAETLDLTLERMGLYEVRIHFALKPAPAE